MFVSVSKTLVTAFLVGTAVLAPGTATAAPEARSFGDCMDIAVGQHDADPRIAHDACEAAELTTCYRKFREAYGRQRWALEACQARTDSADDEA
ncbi:hypothetical protein [Saccharothrix obliqua]|uniref:hypothetical protein n=1 Tax=Saccharothrix obliqua TaxID=2861747 RepID=UPI001C601AB6|nr:hypothetical protein [Saccharothrix obliqua]MBW4716419.1 hypothetical protein [Saccharothrix obliqua]